MDNTKLLWDAFIRKHPFPSPTLKFAFIKGKDWCCWKQHFLSFIEEGDAKNFRKDEWARQLSLFIEWHKKHVHPSYGNVYQATNLEILLRDLDLYYIFKSRQKQESETIDVYIDSLVFIATTSNHNNPVEIVKDKIIQDISSYNFTGKASIFIQSKGENLTAYLKSLDLHNMTMFWKHCQKLMSQNNTGCIRCGTMHSKNCCPAHGVQCYKCKRYNHLTEYCKVKYLSNCTKCGTSHIQSRCLAFGKLCAKCGKMNHFAQFCQVPMVKNCQRCGKDHAITACSAQGKLCPRCDKPNHLEEKCMSKSHIKIN